MIKAFLIWTIECSVCYRRMQQQLADNWCASKLMELSEEELTGKDFIEKLEQEEWEFRRESYEELVPYCPVCKKNN